MLNIEKNANIQRGLIKIWQNADYLMVYIEKRGTVILMVLLLTSQPSLLLDLLEHIIKATYIAIITFDLQCFSNQITNLFHGINIMVEYFSFI